MTNSEAIKIIDQYDCNFYWTDGEKIPTEDLIEAFDLAVKALEEQEPRVLTLDEVKTIGAQNYQSRQENIRLIWSEERNDLNIAKPTYYDFFELEDGEEEQIILNYVGTDFFDTFDQNTYGKNWRCWSARPSDTQRMAVKWDE